MKEAHAVSLSLRREVARISSHNASLQVDLENERKELLNIQEQTSELSENQNMLILSEKRSKVAMNTAMEKTEKLEKIHVELRENLRTSQLARQTVAEQVEELRKEMEQRTRENILNLTELENKNRLEIEIREKKQKEKDLVDKEKRAEKVLEEEEESNEKIIELTNTISNLNVLLKEKHQHTVAWEERALSAESAVEQTTAALSAERMTGQEREREMDEYNKGQERQRSKTTQQEKKLHSLQNRIQDLETSKAELLGELRDRNAETIKMASENKNIKIEYDEEKSKLTNEIHTTTSELERHQDDVERLKRRMQGKFGGFFFVKSSESSVLM